MGANNNVTNTLPARVNHQTNAVSGGAGAGSGGAPNGPSGRHFKPFDHRRINLMAEIQEDPSAGSATAPASASCGANEPIYQRPPVAPQHQQNLIVQKSTHLPHMPSEVRHTNYNGGLGAATQVQQPRKMANPHILEHRDSANFSMASSDSG